MHDVNYSKMIRILKWSFQDNIFETVFGAILRTPGLILCDYWHQKCVDFSIPKSAELADLSDACLHLSVLLRVTLFGIWPVISLHKQFFACKFDFSTLSFDKLE